ncbi:bacteriophage tail protein I [Vibrio ichthyoenteri ATCC 700023]|uniref:Bacteriophage tail protein I n=2 Tax=Vibrio ichthyoenteri TaxID=142461 RepID=F9S7B6_9VIBR|nr:bacteriophage tail protein I [Vibrio ichthyoenteri ATCC 700023]
MKIINRAMSIIGNKASQLLHMNEKTRIMLPLILKTNLRQRAISDLTKEELQSLKKAIGQLQILDIDQVHDSFLPWLAWQWRAEFWDDSWPIEKRRAVVKEALLLFRYKGTPWAISRAMSLLNFDASVLEWHQIPEGINGTFSIFLTQTENRGLTQKDYTDIVNGVERNKRGSQHWKMTVKNSPSIGAIYLPIAVRSRQRVCIRTQPQSLTK